MEHRHETRLTMNSYLRQLSESLAMLVLHTVKIVHGER